MTEIKKYKENHKFEWKTNYSLKQHPKIFEKQILKFCEVLPDLFTLLITDLFTAMIFD